VSRSTDWIQDPIHRGGEVRKPKCFLPGVPRATYMPYPFQIVEGANTVVMVYEYRGEGR
jgi:hypothetical protein